MNNKVKVRVLSIFAFICVFFISGNAFAFCFKPSPPYCINAYGTFENEWSFKRCRNELESYLSDTDAYASCIYDEANDVIERFNCKAKGKSFCL